MSTDRKRNRIKDWHKINCKKMPYVTLSLWKTILIFPPSWVRLLLSFLSPFSEQFVMRWRKKAHEHWRFQGDLNVFVSSKFSLLKYFVFFGVFLQEHSLFFGSKINFGTKQMWEINCFLAHSNVWPRRTAENWRFAQYLQKGVTDTCSAIESEGTCYFTYSGTGSTRGFCC